MVVKRFLRWLDLAHPNNWKDRNMHQFSGAFENATTADKQLKEDFIAMAPHEPPCVTRLLNAGWNGPQMLEQGFQHNGRRMGLNILMKLLDAGMDAQNTAHQHGRPIHSETVKPGTA